MAQGAPAVALAVTAGGSPVTTVKEGTMVTLTATVTTGSAPVTPGQVAFCEVKPAPLRCTDIRLLATKQLVSNGTATFNFHPGPGSHTYQAVFLGTREASTSSAQVSLAVTPYYPTTTTLANNGSMTVTVSGMGGSVPPSGTITLVDTSNGNYVLGTIVLSPVGGAIGFNFTSAAGVPPYPTSNAQISIAAGDFNDDGWPDLAEGLSAAGSYGVPYKTLATTLGNGSGITFGPLIYFPNFYSVNSLLVADFNSDGKEDLLPLFEAGGGGVEVLSGNGDGTFAQPTFGVPAGGAVAVGDFNHDGIPDLAILNPGKPVTSPGTVNIYLGNGDDTFAAGPIAPVGVAPSAITVADFNNDGKQDLAIANPGSNSVTLLLGNGDGTFTAATDLQTAMSPFALAVADFNSDGVPDLAVEDGSGSIIIYLGKGDGSFTQSVQGPLGVTGSVPEDAGLAVGDFNGDGKADLVTADTVTSNSALVFLGNGDGSFQPAISLVVDAYDGPPPIPTVVGLAVADFNGDGLSDFAAAGNADAQSYVLLSQLTLTLQTATAAPGNLFIVGTSFHGVQAVYSGDSNYQPSASAPPTLLYAQLEPTSLALTANPGTSSYGQQVVLTAAIAPSTAQNHVPTGTVTFTDASVPLGTVTVSGGVATLNVTSLPAGIDSLIAIYSGDLNFASSTGYAKQVVSGYSSTATLTAAPNPAGAGQSVTLTATVAGVGTTLVPTGTVALYDGATQLGSAPIDAAGHAKYTTSALSIGVHSLTAAYSGDAVFMKSTSSAISENVIEDDFSIALASPSITLTEYQHTTTSITLTPVGAFSDSVTLAFGTLPKYLTCRPIPTSTALTPSGPANVSLYLDTDSIVGGSGMSGPLAQSSGVSRSPAALALLFSPVLALAALRRRRQTRSLSLTLLALSALPIALALTSCAANQITPVAAVAPGTYTIPITATGATTGISHSTTLTLVVTP